jgi:hypothetical protein
MAGGHWRGAVIPACVGSGACSVGAAACTRPPCEVAAVWRKRWPRCSRSVIAWSLDRAASLLWVTSDLLAWSVAFRLAVLPLLYVLYRRERHRRAGS